MVVVIKNIGISYSDKNIAYHAVLRDMKHLGFSDMKYAIPLKSQMGKLDSDTAHKTVCGIHLEFFDTYLKKAKNRPAFESNDAVIFTEYVSEAGPLNALS